tara:strand:+ start:485 stop:1261 length:777 start_codon:yes stop_codon:yes gene_type:complete
MKIRIISTCSTLSFLFLLALCQDPEPTASTLEQRREYIESLRNNPSEEGLKRKERSIAKLKRFGLPHSKYQQPLPPASEVQLRTKKEILHRSYALVTVCYKAAGVHPSRIEGFMDSFKAHEYLSPDERSFLADTNPTNSEIVEFSWRNESLVVLLWAVGLIQELPYPDSQSNMDPVYTLFQYNYPGELESKANVRSKTEILDKADLIFRMHWAAKESQVNPDSRPVNVNAQVLYQWHYTFNWLIRYMDDTWDNISTDT